jgi:uracil-DNA glycosylase
MKFDLTEVHPSWHSIFSPHVDSINQSFQALATTEIAPTRESIFRVFTRGIDEYRCVIIGQDPYPGTGVADGLAFSTKPGNSIPASLRNIFREYESDLGLLAPKVGDLTRWSKNGVMLLNRSLTTAVGERNVHTSFAWDRLIRDVAIAIGARGYVAILWGKSAQELSSYFTDRIESAHPSPLSARRGFFNSKPFSRTNALLAKRQQSPIDWNLG